MVIGELVEKAIAAPSAQQSTQRGCNPSRKNHGTEEEIRMAKVTLVWQTREAFLTTEVSLAKPPFFL